MTEEQQNLKDNSFDNDSIARAIDKIERNEADFAACVKNLSKV
jgi:hypothetical protein